ncbi:hypothetical protein LCGC14_2287530, partial [marine sediment metagenome]
MRFPSRNATGLVVLAALVIALPVVGFFLARDDARGERDERLTSLTHDLQENLSLGFDADVGVVTSLRAYYA